MSPPGVLFPLPLCRMSLHKGGNLIGNQNKIPSTFPKCNDKSIEVYKDTVQESVSRVLYLGIGEAYMDPISTGAINPHKWMSPHPSQQHRMKRLIPEQHLGGH